MLKTQRSKIPWKQNSDPLKWPVTERSLNRIAESVTDDRIDLGRELKVKTEQLSIIQSDVQGAKEQTFRILLRWKRRYPEKATNGSLYKALRRIKRNDAAENFLKICQDDESADEDSTELPERDHEQLEDAPAELPERDHEQPFYCYEWEDKSGSKHIKIEVDHKFRSDLPQKEQLKLLLEDMQKVLVGDDAEAKALPCQEDLESVQIREFKENSKKIQQQLHKDLEDLNRDAINLEKLKDMAKELQELHNALAQHLTFSKGKMENIHEVEMTCNQIEGVEKKYEEALNKIKNSGVDERELNAITVEHKLRVEQNVSLEKLLSCLINNFSKGKPENRWSWSPFSNERDGESERPRFSSLPTTQRTVLPRRIPEEGDDEESRSNSERKDREGSHQANSTEDK